MEVLKNEKCIEKFFFFKLAFDKRWAKVQYRKVRKASFKKNNPLSKTYKDFLRAALPKGGRDVQSMEKKTVNLCF